MRSAKAPASTPSNSPASPSAPPASPTIFSTSSASARASSLASTVSVFFSGIGLPYTLHWCRHRFGTQHYKLFRDIRATQELMGHASPATTAMYVQLSQERAKRSMDRLGKTLPVTEKRPAAVDGQTAPRSRRRSA